MLSIDFCSWVSFFGLIIAISSLCLKVWAYEVLGENWSDKIAIYEQHSLVTTGPYKWIKHPIYTSYMMLTAGAFLVTGSFLLLFFGISYVAIDVIRSDEEKLLLTKKFEQEYANYSEDIGDFVPTSLSLGFLTFVIATNVIGITINIILYIQSCITVVKKIT